ncbi:MAG: hypothetical protein U5R49_27645 [Deltaproteobacteria bacterium]|nr:hypothetical protein [Deltaproteobacteria bacterium]
MEELPSEKRKGTGPGPKAGLSDNIRLACQTRIKGDMTIRRPVVDDLDIKIILKQLEEGPGSKLGQEKELAILFTDIEHYTQFAEAFPAYDVVHVLSRYYQDPETIWSSGVEG